MKIRDLNQVSWLKSTDLENIFSIFVDRLSRQMYNLNKGLYINVRSDSLETFTLTHDMHWPLISYKIYGTTRLAWLLQKVNNVSAKDIFKIKYAGEQIKYLSESYIIEIIEILNADE